MNINKLKMRCIVLLIQLMLITIQASASPHDITKCRIKHDMMKFGGTSASATVGIGGAIATAFGVIPASSLIPISISVAHKTYSTSKDWLLGKRFYQGAEAYYKIVEQLENDLPRSRLYFKGNNACNLHENPGKHCHYYVNTALKKWGKLPGVLAQYLHNNDIGKCNLVDIKEALAGIAD